jgi:hypothetical protein
MSKHVLFLLKSGFSDDQGGPFFCPDCAALEGFLSYAPEVASELDIRRVAFQRPRQDLIAQLGAANQGCPVLVLAETAELPPEATCSEETGKAFISGSTAICDYLGRIFSVARPHA